MCHITRRTSLPPKQSRPRHKRRLDKWCLREQIIPKLHPFPKCEIKTLHTGHNRKNSQRGRQNHHIRGSWSILRCGSKTDNSQQTFLLFFIWEGGIEEVRGKIVVYWGRDGGSCRLGGRAQWLMIRTAGPVTTSRWRRNLVLCMEAKRSGLTICLGKIHGYIGHHEGHSN